MISSNRTTNHLKAQKPAVIYARVSTRKQEIEGNGLSSQITTCGEYCYSMGLDVVRVFQDDETGKERKGLNQMKAFLKEHKNKGVTVAFDVLSRMARDVVVDKEIKSYVSSTGAKYCCPTFSFEESPEAELQKNIQISFVQYHLHHNAAQTRRRQKARLLDGHWCFTAPFVFKFPGKKQRLAPDPTLGPIVKKAMEGFASGVLTSQAQVTAFIESQPEFKRTRKQAKLSNRMVPKILNNPLYCGQIQYEEWGVSLRDGRHEGLVSVRTFAQIQNRLKDTSRSTRGSSQSEHFPLRRFLICADCENFLTGSFQRGKGGCSRYYFCFKKHCNSFNKFIDANDIEKNPAYPPKKATA